MTRFCVTLTALDALQTIVDACENCGFKTRRAPFNQVVHLRVRSFNMRVSFKLLISDVKDRLSFVVNVYEMQDAGTRKVLVDFRRSKGDGLDFKRAFIQLRNGLGVVICKQSDAWLEMQGLVCSQAMSQLAIVQDGIA
jgi:hypothetical protein